MNDEEVVRKSWVEAVHVDEDGSFSDCPDYCDDCFWHSHWDVHTVPAAALPKVKNLSNTFVVRSSYGKNYTYFAPTNESVQYLLDNFQTDIDEARGRLDDDAKARVKAKAEGIRKVEEKKQKEADAEAEREKINKVIEDFISEKGLVEVNGAPTDGESTQIGFVDGGISTKRATWFPDSDTLKMNVDAYDDWRVYYYTTPGRAVGINQKDIDLMVEDPSGYLIETIFHHRSDGAQGCDYSDCYGSALYKDIMADKDLADRVIENMKVKLTSKELSEDEMRQAEWGPIHSPSSSGLKNSIELLGVEAEVQAAFEVRQKKAVVIKTEKETERKAKREIRDAEREKEMKEEAARKAEERKAKAAVSRKAKKDRVSDRADIEDKIKGVHEELVLKRVNAKSVSVTIGDGSFLERSVFSDAVAAVKSVGGKYKPKTKTWTIPI